MSESRRVQDIFKTNQDYRKFKKYIDMLESSDFKSKDLNLAIRKIEDLEYKNELLKYL
jgi:predicted transcriptional regulator